LKNYNRVYETCHNTKCYKLDNKLHRTDGPAIEFKDGSKFWFINHRQYSEQEFNDYITNLKIPEYFNEL